MLRREARSGSAENKPASQPQKPKEWVRKRFGRVQAKVSAPAFLCALARGFASWRETSRPQTKQRLSVKFQSYCFIPTYGVMACTANYYRRKFVSHLAQRPASRIIECH